MSFLSLGIVGEMVSGSRSVARGRILGHGRGCEIGSHHTPPLVHIEDPIHEDIRRGNSVEKHSET